MSNCVEVEVKPAENGKTEETVTEYKSIISSRPAFNRVFSSSMTNLSAPPMSSGTRISRTVHEYHSSGTSGMMSGMASGMPGGYAQQIRDNREKEKQEMRDLNDKLASFIEKVRFLDAQNSQLTKKLEHLHKCLGKVKSSTSIYETEIRGAEEVIRKSNTDREQTEKDFEGLKKILDELRKKLEEADRSDDKQKIDDLLIELSNLEAEINLMKRRIALLEEEKDYTRKENMRIKNELQTTRQNIDQQAILSLQFKNEVSNLLELLKFEKSAQDDQLKDLLLLAARDTTSENREMFGNELSKAMREIREEYDMINQSHRHDLESKYYVTVQEFETAGTKHGMEGQFQKEELKRLKSQVIDLRNRLAELGGRNAQLEKHLEELNYQMADDERVNQAELEEKDRLIRKERDNIQAHMVEYQMLLDKKQSLENEIGVYRKILEGEGAGQASGMQQLVENYVKTTGINEVVDTETMRVVKGETSSRSSHTRSAKGNVIIQEIGADCKSISLKNTSKSKDEQLGGWKLRRKIDGKKDIVFAMPEEFTLNAGETVTIIAGVSATDLPNQLPFPQHKSFGQGINVQTLLFNKDGEERALLIQREVISSVQEAE